MLAVLLAGATGLAAHAQVPRDVPDARIADHVRTELRTSDGLDPHRVSVRVEDGVVQLSGRTATLLERRRAVDLARSTAGVRAVVDRVEVRATDREASAIAKDVRAALAADPATEGRGFEVRVERGTTTLRGTARSYAEQRIAEAVAAGVRGVRGIENDIVIGATADRPDDEIAADVRRRLAGRVTVDDRRLEVAVRDGVVHLSGVAGSAAEKWRAHDLAWVAGVRDVAMDEVAVEWWARDRLQRPELAATRSDAAVRAAVEDALRLDPRVDPSGVRVLVADGRVTLRGEVSDLSARRAAAATALDTVGAWDLENHLQVTPGTDVADEIVAARVRATLRRDALVDRFDVTVSVINGHAHLYGTVDGAAERARARVVAGGVRGVVHVADHLEARDGWTPEEDWRIREDVVEQLRWSPFVDAGEIAVAVDDGVATLTGTVDTLRERSIAAADARQGGARRVRNDLLVRYGPDALRP